MYISQACLSICHHENCSLTTTRNLVDPRRLSSVPFEILLDWGQTASIRLYRPSGRKPYTYNPRRIEGPHLTSLPQRQTSIRSRNKTDLTGSTRRFDLSPRPREPYSRATGGKEKKINNFELMPAGLRLPRWVGVVKPCRPPRSVIAMFKHEIHHDLERLRGGGPTEPRVQQARSPERVSGHVG